MNLQKRKRLTDFQNELMVARALDREKGQLTSLEWTCTLLYLKQITNQALLYSTWNSAQCYVAAKMAGEFAREWMHAYVWLSPFAIQLNLFYYVNQLCCCSVTQLCLNLCNPMDCSTSGLPVLQYLQSSPKFILTEWVMPPNHPILSCPILLLPSIFPASGSFPIRRISTSGGKALELQLQNQSF